MLQDIERTPWATLTHANGTSTDLPALIQSLLSNDPVVYREALYILYTQIYHQGTVYEVTPYVVPLLLELLDSPFVSCQAEILILLGNLAQCSSYLALHQHLDCLYTPDERASSPFQAQLQRELQWVQQTHSTVAQGLELYLQLLNHPEPAIRCSVPYLLARLDEQSQRSVPALVSRLYAETVDTVQASLLFCLGQLNHHDTFYLNLLTGLLETSELQLVRVVSAMELVHYAPATAPSVAIDLLLETIACASELSAIYAELPWARTNLLTDLYELLCLLNLAQAELALTTLLAKFAQVDSAVIPELQLQEAAIKSVNVDQPPPESIIKMAAAMRISGMRELQSALRVLLHIAFGGRSLLRGSTARVLTSTQRLVLTAIVNSEAAWIVNGSTENALRSFGLLQWEAPRALQGRDKLRLFLESA